MHACNDYNDSLQTNYKTVYSKLTCTVKKEQREKRNCAFDQDAERERKERCVCVTWFTTCLPCYSAGHFGIICLDAFAYFALSTPAFF